MMRTMRMIMMIITTIMMVLANAVISLLMTSVLRMAFFALYFNAGPQDVKIHATFMVLTLVSPESCTHATCNFNLV